MSDAHEQTETETERRVEPCFGQCGIAELRAHCASVDAQREEYEQVVDSFNESVPKLHDRIQALGQQLAEMTGRIVGLCDINNRLHERSVTMTRWKAGLERHLADVTRERDQLRTSSEEAESQLAEMTKARDDAQATSREKIHRAFKVRADDGSCACPYCTEDAEGLADMVGNYELDMHAAKDRAEAAQARADAAEQARDQAREDRQILLDTIQRQSDEIARHVEQAARLMAERDVEGRE